MFNCRYETARAITIVVALMYAGCARHDSFDGYVARVAGRAGQGALNCGVVRLGEQREQALSCLANALTHRRPAMAIIQKQGIESEIFDALAVDAGGRGTLIRWDGDVSGGYSFLRAARVTESPCANPRVSSAPPVFTCGAAGP